MSTFQESLDASTQAASDAARAAIATSKLIGTPADSTIATAMQNAGTQSNAYLNSTYAQLSSPGVPFPPPVAPSASALVTSVQAAADESTLPKTTASGTNVTLTTLAAADRDAFFFGGGKPFVAPWPGNSFDVVKAGVHQNDIGSSAWTFSVRTNATWLIIRGNFVYGSTTALSRMIRVNGMQITPRTVAQSDPLVSGAFGAILIEFVDSSYKSVQIHSAGQIRSYVTNTGATIAAHQPLVTRKKLYILGDSWTSGTDQASPVGSYARVLQHTSPWDVSYNGQGGTGYVAGTTNSYQCIFGDSRRVQAITEWAPDVLVVFGSINDNGKASSDVGTAATALYSAIASGSPSTKIIVIGPQKGDGTNPANSSALQSAANAASNVLGYVDPVTEMWARDGVLGPSDMLHPSVTGAEYLARLIEATVRRLTVASGDNSW